MTRSRKIILATLIFYLLSGLSAIFLPSSWYFLAGVESNKLADTLMVLIGTLMLGLSMFAGLAYFSIVESKGIALCLVAINAMDLAFNIWAYNSESISFFGLSLFLAIDVILIIGLSYVVVESRQKQ